MMIEANELRLGNNVLFNGKVDSIIEIGQAGNGYCEKEGYFNFDSGTIEAIPLTPEWLGRCGFNAVSDQNVDNIRYSLQVGNNLYINHYVRSGSWCVEPENWTNEQMCYLQPKYLHQLQNLYFALTGEELKIEL